VGWPKPENMRTSRVRTLVAVFCLTLAGAAVCEVVERLVSLRVSLWQAQSAEAVLLAAGHRVPGLAGRVQRALGALKEEAAVSQEDPHIGTDPPASAPEIQEFVGDLDKRMSQLALTER